MAGLSRGMMKAFVAETAITRRRIVKFGAADNAVVQAAAATDLGFGVASEIDAAIGQTCDVVLSDIADVEFGGAVTRGAKLTADAQGRAVAAAPAAGVNAQVIGLALVSAVAGDVGPVLLKQSVMQG
jgi:hypothetical protein